MQSRSLIPGLDVDPFGLDANRVLVVILHGWSTDPRSMGDLSNAARGAFVGEFGVDLYVPKLAYSKWNSFASPDDVTSKLLGELDEICVGDRYSRIILVGHSIGGVIARRLFLVAVGMNEIVPSEGSLQDQQIRSWGVRICRIITLGALNRGWIRSGRLGWAESLVTTLVAAAGHGWPGTKSPTLFQFRRGAPFIVGTRLQWLALQRDPSRTRPVVVQLLGTQDNLVAPDDAVDFAVDGVTASNYFYIELPQTNHGDAIVFTASRSDPDGCYGERRKNLFKAALVEEGASLGGRSVRRDFLADTLPAPSDEQVKEVVFVIHGIREDGYWTRRVAQKILETAADRGDGKRDAYRTITASYGYFAMLPFIWPWLRRQKVEWFMDEFVGAVVRYPRAQFSYVGHSNGTYLLARALLDYPATTFRNVLFAGSVVRRDYDWRQMITSGRVRLVVNMVAAADWVVAIFPSGLESLRSFDLGGAGFGGFRQVVEGDELHEVRYVAGSHGAALVESQWPQIAKFIVNDAVPGLPDPDYVTDQSRLLQIASRFSGVIILAILFMTIIVPGIVVLSVIARLSGADAALWISASFVYLQFLWFVITRL